MPVVTFHHAQDPTAHENFMRWCKENPLGLFVKAHATGATLHRVGCPHIDHREPGERSLCSEEHDELVVHAERELGHPPVKCPQCL